MKTKILQWLESLLDGLFELPDAEEFEDEIQPNDEQDVCEVV